MNLRFDMIEIGTIFTAESIGHSVYRKVGTKKAVLHGGNNTTFNVRRATRVIVLDRAGRVTSAENKITIQYRTWKNGRPGEVKEKTFPSQAAFESAMALNERHGADVEILRYSSDASITDAVQEAASVGRELAARLTGPAAQEVCPTCYGLCEFRTVSDIVMPCGRCSKGLVAA